MKPVEDRQKLINEIASEINVVRKNPKSYIPILEQYLTYFQPGTNIMQKPWDSVPLETYEGPIAVKECIEFLKVQRPMNFLLFDERLSMAAQDHSDDIGENGLYDHIGTDGSCPEDRVDRYIMSDGTISENLDFGNRSAQEIIVSLIVDDGVDRTKERSSLFQPNIKHVGIGIAEHDTFGVCTVLAFCGKILSYKQFVKPVKAIKSENIDITKEKEIKGKVQTNENLEKTEKFIKIENEKIKEDEDDKRLTQEDLSNIINLNPNNFVVNESHNKIADTNIKEEVKQSENYFEAENKVKNKSDININTIEQTCPEGIDKIDNKNENKNIEKNTTNDELKKNKDILDENIYDRKLFGTNNPIYKPNYENIIYNHNDEKNENLSNQKQDSSSTVEMNELDRTSYGEDKTESLLTTSKIDPDSPDDTIEVKYKRITRKRKGKIVDIKLFKTFILSDGNSCVREINEY